jgi:hypothetical protein
VNCKLTILTADHTKTRTGLVNRFENGVASAVPIKASKEVTFSLRGPLPHSTLFIKVEAFCWGRAPQWTDGLCWVSQEA